MVTNFDAAFSPVVSEKSSKISKPELLSMRSEYVQHKLSVISENPTAMKRVGKAN